MEVDISLTREDGERVLRIENFTPKDLDGNEVVDDDLYDEIVDYFEGEEGELIDPFSFDEYEEDYD